MDNFKLEPGYLIMPNIGDITTGKALGKKTHHKYIWLACADCGREYWVTKAWYDNRRREGRSPICLRCHNKRLGQRIKGKARKPGAKRFSQQGYVLVRLSPDDFFFPMADCHGYVFEHRLVMAQQLKRCLLSWEIVHHKNGVKDDNRLENLKLFSIQTKHLPFTEMKKRIKYLERRVTLLEGELVLLRKQQEEVSPNV